VKGCCEHGNEPSVYITWWRYSFKRT